MLGGEIIDVQVGGHLSYGMLKINIYQTGKVEE